ncbi:Abi family protein [Enemella evansiae]|uniref:Abortive phage infection protein n=1 Tax=Enemella evansiae TaxID=2016499 RepID=A0A255GNY3_9ACTN|nr:Abi family protein [Enemella evansiae]OYO14037.1 abortive phage infection protein [Enemella evansiae]OYO17525.1 abortive phage infection protein [Enemella evansiae]TDO89548.1 abortive infection bacteriophage resistance protein [Enemella evansiae]
MVEYSKPWLPVEGQVDRLVEHGLDVGDREHAARVLEAIGYYRLTGYLYPFRESEEHVDDDGRTRIRVLGDFRPGTRLAHAEEIIDFDRELRMLVLDGLERVEVAVRMPMGYVLGRSAVFAYEDPSLFMTAFTADGTDVRDPKPSKHVQWLQRVRDRQAGSDEQFVEHFRTKYDDRMPVWALTEILELGHLSVLYRGMNQKDAEEVARAFGVPGKRMMASWLASLNYVRNVSAHHARLFNRKLQNAPSRPKIGQIPVLDHLRDSESAKQVYGTYNALAVIAYLLPSIEARSTWSAQLASLLRRFPATEALTIQSLGAPEDWASLALWQS